MQLQYEVKFNPIKSPAAKKVCGPEESQCEIQGGSQEMAVMVG